MKYESDFTGQIFVTYLCDTSTTELKKTVMEVECVVLEGHGAYIVGYGAAWFTWNALGMKGISPAE